MKRKRVGINEKLVLAGNPNSGKTSLFNELTKGHQHIGNWAGVTIEKKEGRFYKDKSIAIYDLPGTYSLSPYSIEEIVSRNFLLQNDFDGIIDVVDSTNLERNLLLLSQFLELDSKLVVALNMADELEKSGKTINNEYLQNEFGCEFLSVSAVKKQNINSIIKTSLKKSDTQKKYFIFPTEVENVILDIEKIVGNIENNKRFYLVKLFEKDHKIFEKLNLSKTIINQIKTVIKPLEEKYGMNSCSIITTERYKIIDKVCKNCISEVKVEDTSTNSVSDKIDKVVTNKYLAIPIFILIMGAIFYISVADASIGGLGMLSVQGMSKLISIIAESIRSGLVSISAPLWVQSLLVDGIISGVGSVLSYVPQIMILFFFMSLLEGCGYMARIAFIMDRLFSKVGLSGKSLIPMILGTGCSVPAIMGTRTIKNKRERETTILATTFIPCSAKLPVFTTFAASLFITSPLKPVIALSLYLVGILVALNVSYIIKLFSKKTETADDTFIMELPPYRIPTFKNVVLNMWDKAKSFIKKAGTVIFVACFILWFLQSFTTSFQYINPDAVNLQELTSKSLLATVSGFFAPIFIPLGFGSWQAVSASMTGFVAKEMMLSTFVIVGVANKSMGVIAIDPSFMTSSVAYSFLLFNLLVSPCVASLGTMKSELGSFKKLLKFMCIQFSVAYLISLTFYQMSRLYQVNLNAFWIVLVAIVFIFIFGIMLASYLKNKKNGKIKYITCVGCVNENNCSKAQKEKCKEDKKTKI